jgi:uncharacterized membrane protein YgdD (TMEM256/DUF423 family)
MSIFELPHDTSMSFCACISNGNRVVSNNIVALSYHTPLLGQSVVVVDLSSIIGDLWFSLDLFCFCVSIVQYLASLSFFGGVCTLLFV